MAITPFEFEVPLRLKTPNVEEHHRARAARRKRERDAVRLLFRSAKVRQDLPPSPWLVTLTREAPTEFDEHDNLTMSLKSVADEVTACLKLKNDRTPLLEWHYAQQRATNHVVRIRIEHKPQEASITWEEYHERTRISADHWVDILMERIKSLPRPQLEELMQRIRVLEDRL